jgi:hypothetical protein
VLIQNINKTEASNIYCRVGDGLIFARVDVVDPRTGISHFTDWVRSDKSQWLHWTARADQSWPDLVNITLTLTADDPTLPKTIADKLSTLFIASESPLTEILLKKYAELAYFRENPVRVGKDKSGTFYYFLDYPSDLQIQIYRSESGARPLSEIKDENLPSGKGSEPWDFGSVQLQPGDYSAFFRLKSRDPRGVQPDYAVLVHVQ